MTNSNYVNLGECFTIKYLDKFRSIIVIEANHSDGEYSITPLINVLDNKPSIDEFINAEILAQQYTDKIIPDGVFGLYAIHLLQKHEFDKLKDSFEYIGKLKLDESKIKIGGGTTLRENIAYADNFITPDRFPEFIKMLKIKVRDIVKD